MRLTVFTATYNRGNLLENLYQSLCNQTHNDFEWLIIDDGSTDGTEDVVSNWLNNSPFAIRYIIQEHGGKHRALNKGFDLAKGEYFFIVDSDDYIINEAIEFIYQWIGEISSREDLAGVSGLKIYKESGKTVGGYSDKIKWVEALNFERNQKNLLGDKAEVYRTKVLKEFPFPEFEGEYFITEAVCWNRIAAAGYKIRWYMKGIYICEYREDGLSKNGANDIRGKLENFLGYTCYVRDLIRFRGMTSNPIELNQYMKICNIKNKSRVEISKDLNISKFSAFFFRIFIIIGALKGIARRLKKIIIG